MARIARDPVDVILGEAGGRSWSERYNDMLAIASVIDNRARAGRVSYQDVVAVQSQFNAYGKSLPRGVENFRSLAQMALEQVQRTGPIHNATYYATTAAAKNLPQGLQPVTQTAGHVYMEDPMGRSFLTAQGYVSPAPITTAFGDQLTPEAAPVPTAAPRGLGMAALAPNGLRPGQIDLSPLSAPGKGRSEVPTSGIVGKVAESANRTVPGAITSLWSGMEPAGRAPVGAPGRHPGGFAGDFDFFDPQGNRITDPVAMHDIAMDMAARHDANIGYDQIGYMGPGRMHIDTMPIGPGGFPGGAQWGATAKDWAGNLDFARETGIGPTPYSNAPTPVSREAGLAMPVADPTARAAQEQSMAALGPVGGMTAPAIAARQAEDQSMSALRTDQQAVQAAIEDAAQKPAIDPANAYAQMAATMGQAGLLGLDGRKGLLEAPPLTERPPAASLLAPPVQAPVQAPVSVPSAPQPVAPSIPTGIDAISSLFGAPEGQTARASWDDVTFTSLGDGRVSKTNQYGTSILSPEDYSHPSTGKRSSAPRNEAQQRANAMGRRGFLGVPEAKTPLGNTVRGALGGAAGTLAGGLLGPFGGMIGGMLGAQIARGKNPFSRGGILSDEAFRSAMAGYTPGLAFPSAPVGHSMGQTGGPSFSEMASISPAAAAAIAEGRAGLY